MERICNIRRPLSDGEHASETSFGVNAMALLLSSFFVYLCYQGGMRHPVELFILLMVFLLVLTVGLEVLCFGRRSALLQLRVRRKMSWKRVFFRETALLVTFAVIGLAYWTIPAFTDKSVLRYYYPFLSLVVPLVVVLSFPYFCLMDKLDVEEEDALCRVGRAILTFRRTMSRFEFANFVRSWIIKAFWLSLMQPLMVEKIRVFMYYHYDKLRGSPLEVFLMASTICYAIDLAYASTGYALNFKMFNTHTRTAEPFLSGWVVALMCYWPFWGCVIGPYFFKYEGKDRWFDVLFTMGSAAWWCWAALIIVCELVYALASVSAGIRFSNLTYRGLWNTGPYRWTKHPAYVFKNLSWWFISLPFVLNSGSACVKCTLLLLATNVLYYLRARTEERHLSHYPEYVAYAMEMNEKSIFRWCARIFPFLRFRPPESGCQVFEA